ncbi:ABC-F family ATP-binding cassette domain-containing protein [bacterium]|nr:ABC-F family ATP-binding cassette domain-containing protein [bacterium]
MSALVQLDSVSVQLGEKQVFQDLRLTVPQRARIGIVGPNGSGKSTLLRVMAELLVPDSGRVLVESTLRTAYVPQNEEFDEDQSVSEAMSARLKGVHHADPEVAGAKALSRAGFSDFSLPVKQLSGGWKKRLSLAAAMAREPELLLLDEPTNHLDREGLLWLERYLQTASFGWVMVSHDRYFLNETVEKIMEISPIFPNGFFESSGNFLEYRAKRAEFLEQEAKRTSSLANKARRELEWASRSPKARTGKASFRLKEAARLKEELRSARSRQQDPEKFTAFQSSERGSKELVELIKVTFGFDETPLIRQLSFTLRNRSCLGILGANGQGKSTLLRLIGGELTPDTGKVKQVAGLRIVYFDQLRESLREWKTLGELLGDGSDSVVYGGRPCHVIGWGARFGFQAEDHRKPLSTLSGGEQARALLSVLVRQEADLLLLDEPTNDLDIPMLEALEKMILEFPGAVVLITHDRFMLDEVCTSFLGFLQEGTVREFADREQWLAEQERQQEVSAPKEKVAASEKASPSSPKFTYNDQREYSKIERKIEKAEAALVAIEERAADPKLHEDPEQSIAISEELADAKRAVEALYDRWEELDKRRAASSSS